SGEWPSPAGPRKAGQLPADARPTHARRNSTGRQRFTGGLLGAGSGTDQGVEGGLGLGLRPWNRTNPILPGRLAAAGRRPSLPSPTPPGACSLRAIIRIGSAPCPG